jgi:predicted transcriptional regulator
MKKVGTAWAKLGLAADRIAVVNTLEHLSPMSYVEREEKREQFQQHALAGWTHFQTTGLHATAEEADAWLAKLEAGKDAAPPKCHILRAPPFASR